MVDRTAQSKEDLRSCISSLESSLKAESDCVAQSKKVCAGKVAGHKHVPLDRFEAYDAMRYQLQERDENLREARGELTTKISRLKSLGCSEKVFEKEL